MGNIRDTGNTGSGGSGEDGVKKLLIIEDEEAIADLEKDYLELSGYAVEVAGDGETGRRMALEGRYDLYIIDLMLPGIDGFALCREIREHTSEPILIVSARREDIDKIRGLGLGADDYITKPFSPGELVARVGAHLAQYERIRRELRPSGEVIRLGEDARLDVNAHTLMVDGVEKSLTVKEYELLCFLAQHPNQVFSKEELFQRVWDGDSIGDDHTVTVFIKKLRSKLEKDPAAPKYIETVWGTGYRLRIG